MHVTCLQVTRETEKGMSGFSFKVFSLAYVTTFDEARPPPLPLYQLHRLTVCAPLPVWQRGQLQSVLLANLWQMILLLSFPVCTALFLSRHEGQLGGEQRGAAQVLLLDADNQPLRNPAPLFDEEAFRSTGGLFWPDWCASTRRAQTRMELLC